MKLGSFGSLAAASLVGFGLGLAALPAAAQTIPSRIALVESQSDVIEVGHYRHRNWSHRPRHVYRHHRRGPSISFGFALGAPYVAAPYYAPYAAPLAPYSAGLSPGSAAWIDYCSRKYRSFNPATGMYLSYSGVWQTCRVP